MAAVQSLRAVLVAGAGVALVIAGIYRLWSTVAILAVALAAHGLYSVRQRRSVPRTPFDQHRGIPG